MRYTPKMADQGLPPDRVRRQVVFALLAVVAALMLAACSLDYGRAQIAQSIEADIPDLILINFDHTAVRHGRRTFEVSADRSEFFSQKKTQTLENVHFQEFDTKGIVVTEGTAEHAILHTDSNDVELSGAISFYSSAEKARVSCTYLYWHDEDRKLTSTPADIVSIRKDNGTVITGSDFSADVARREVTFGGPVHGTVVADDSADNGADSTR